MVKEFKMFFHVRFLTAEDRNHVLACCLVEKVTENGGKRGIYGDIRGRGGGYKWVGTWWVWVYFLTTHI